MRLAYINHSTIVTDVQAEAMATACMNQVNFHAAPLYDPLGRTGGMVGQFFASKVAPAGWDIMNLFDDADQAGALGYHSESQDGSVFGKVFVKTTLSQAGTQIMNGPGSVCSVLSHESLEWWQDRNVDRWVQANDGTLYALELCDAVENDVYTLTHTYGGSQVTVSNFILPSWMDDTPPAGSKFDYLGKLTAPFTLSPGGYVIYMAGSQSRQKFGSLSNAVVHSLSNGMQLVAHFGRNFPDWKKEAKLHELSRTARRLAKTI